MNLVWGGLAQFYFYFPLATSFFYLEREHINPFFMKRYQIFRGVDSEIELYGLRGKYLYYSIGIAVGTIFFTILLFMIGSPALVNIALLFMGLAFAYVYPTHEYKKNGRWGTEKLPIAAAKPKVIFRKTSFKNIISQVRKW